MTIDQFRELVLERLPPGHTVDATAPGGSDADHHVEVKHLATSKKFSMLVEGTRLARPREAEEMLEALVSGALAAFVS